MNLRCESATKATGWSTRSQIVAITCACAASSTFLYAFDPVRHGIYPQCLLYRTTGIYCAGCGATRALYALFHGRLLEGLHDNVLFVAALPVALWLGGAYAFSAWKTNHWPVVFIDSGRWLRYGIGFLAAMLAFMALRNLPGWPFDLLKPL